MKSLFCILCLLLLAACAQTSQRVGEVNWPTDPAQRAVAERHMAKADRGEVGDLPPGFVLAFRDFDDKLIVDHFDYDLTGLSPQQLQEAYRENTLVAFFNERRLRACKDHEARFLIDQGYSYAFLVTLIGSKKKETVEKVLRKGFCVAMDRPLVNQQAIDDRYNKVRYWPNGERVDVRLIEELTGSFQLLAARFEPPSLPGQDFFVVDLKADGLMLSIWLKQKHKKDTNLNKFWQQIAKGQSLEKNCIAVSHLAALTVGAVYSYRLDIYSDSGVVDSTVYTISYPDCLLYNRK